MLLVKVKKKSKTNLEQSNNPSWYKWINRLWYIHAMELLITDYRESFRGKYTETENKQKQKQT